MSVVIAVLSILTVCSITFGTSTFKELKNTKNSQKVQVIQEALKNYFKQNKRLPRPADYLVEKTSSNYGYEKVMKSSYDIEHDSTFHSYKEEHYERIYQEVEWIELPNNNNYIDTHYSIQSDSFSISIKFMLFKDNYEFDQNAYTYTFIQDISSGGNFTPYTFSPTIAPIINNDDNCSILNFGVVYQNNYAMTTISKIPMKRYNEPCIITQEFNNGNVKLSVDRDRISFTVEDAVFNSNYLYLLKQDSLKNYTTRIYYATIYSSKKDRDFIPVYLLKDIKAKKSADDSEHKKDEVGLWDKVEDKFYPIYTSQSYFNTSQLRKGPDKNTSYTLIDGDDVFVDVKYVMYKGIVPFNTLGLAENDVIDEFGNYYEYYVPDIMTIQNEETPYHDENIYKKGYELKNGNYGTYTKYPCVGDGKQNKTPEQLCTKNEQISYGIKFEKRPQNLYQKVEWIENVNDYSYIDTQYIAERNYLKVAMKFIPLYHGEYYGNNIYRIFGAKQSTNTLNLWSNDDENCPIKNLSVGENENVLTDAEGNILTNIDGKYNEVINLELTAKENKVYGSVNKTSIETKYNGEIENYIPMYLFALNDSNSPQIAKSRLYYAKIYSSYGLARDFIPVYLLKDLPIEKSADGIEHKKNEIGLWDQVEEQFYTYTDNHNTTDDTQQPFVKGPDAESEETEIYIQPPYGLRVKDVKTKKYIDNNGTIAYVLVSHGKNGNETCCIKHDKDAIINKTYNNFTTVKEEKIPEAQNCIDAKIYNDVIGRSEFLTDINKEFTFYTGDTNADFDDIVVFKTLDELITLK